MAVRAALVVALQLLLKTYLHAGAQVLGECPPKPGPRLRALRLAVNGDERRTLPRGWKALLVSSARL